MQHRQVTTLEGHEVLWRAEQRASGCWTVRVWLDPKLKTESRGRPTLVFKTLLKRAADAFGVVEINVREYVLGRTPIGLELEIDDRTPLLVAPDSRELSA
jgi:hypothetical protein